MSTSAGRVITHQGGGELNNHQGGHQAGEDAEVARRPG